MNSKNISISHHNEEHGDDCYRIDDGTKNNIIVIVCDGVSSSTSGRIASYLVAKTALRHLKSKLSFATKNVDHFFFNLPRKIALEFCRFHVFISEFKTQHKSEKA